MNKDWIADIKSLSNSSLMAKLMTKNIYVHWYLEQHLWQKSFKDLEKISSLEKQVCGAKLSGSQLVFSYLPVTLLNCSSLIAKTLRM